MRRLLSKKGVMGFFCLFVGVGVLWWLLVPKEPSYQGKTLTEWQEEVMNAYPAGSMRSHQGYLNGIRQKFGAPFKAMGTNVIPFLLQQIQAKDLDFEQWVSARCEDRGWPVPFFRNEWHDRRCAEKSFAVLKEHAYSAVPELLRLAREDGELRPVILQTLTGMEVTSEEFLRLLVELAQSNSEVDRLVARDCLYKLGYQAKDAIPMLEKVIVKYKENGWSTSELEHLRDAISKEF